ncbi:biopolymer transporter ExbD [Erythrobacter sp. THAF29]|uniref:ExbD/TolR family protein n=1 Tax=Erythrobacter sp. THAF29 TaxID=2587851 RepID=UPI001267EF43|nr:biopolymer transporter ExbD [Erythrobacter sp. THAF29]QFT76193.1 hypothetical protein FIU90_01425 [Erythrobacter sp. THAF29]
MTRLGSARGSRKNNSGGRFSPRPFRRRKRKPYDHGEPICRIDIRPIALFAALFAILALMWNLGNRQTHTLLIDLPQGPLPIEPHKLSYSILDISSTGQISFDGQPVELGQIAQAIKNTGIAYPTVLVRPDGNAPYGVTALVLDALVDAGVARDEICFDELEKHRLFQRSTLVDESTLPPDEESRWRAPDKDIEPSGCSKLMMLSAGLV